MKKMSTAALGLITAAILLGGIGLSSLLGLWNVSSSKTPVKIKTGEFAGLPNPADIRGSYTWDTISSSFNIPVAFLVEAFEAASSADKVNLLEAAYAGKIPDGFEIGTDSVRLFVSLYTGIPYEAETGTLIQESAAAVLAREGKKAPADAVIYRASGSAPTAVSEPAAHTSSSQSAAVSAPAAQSAPASSVTVSSAPADTPKTAFQFTGKTTFADLEKAGFDMKKVEQITGKIPSTGATIKSAAEAQGKEYSEFKEKLTLIAP